VSSCSEVAASGLVRLSELLPGSLLLQQPSSILITGRFHCCGFQRRTSPSSSYANVPQLRLPASHELLVLVL
jgi:hypothetical protein